MKIVPAVLEQQRANILEPPPFHLATREGARHRNPIYRVEIVPWLLSKFLLRFATRITMEGQLVYIASLNEVQIDRVK